MIVPEPNFISEDEFTRVWGARVKPNGEPFAYEDLVGLPVQQVWTIYEDGSIDAQGNTDNNWYAMPGMAPAFAIGYVVTEKPWGNDTPPAIWYEDDDELSREERRLFLLEQLQPP